MLIFLFNSFCFGVSLGLGDASVDVVFVVTEKKKELHQSEWKYVVTEKNEEVKLRGPQLRTRAMKYYLKFNSTSWPKHMDSRNWLTRNIGRHQVNRNRGIKAVMHINIIMVHFTATSSV